MDKHLLNTMCGESGFTPGQYCIALYDGFKKFKDDAVYLVETGTHFGNGTAIALLAGFEKVFTCELDEFRHQHCVGRFNDYPVELFQGFSTEGLRKIMPKLDKKTMFWLDAHAEGGGVPTMEELDIISEYTKDSTILIDDIPDYFGDGEALKKKLLDINPEDTIEMWHNDVRPDWMMVAYIK